MNFPEHPQHLSCVSASKCLGFQQGKRLASQHWQSRVARSLGARGMVDAWGPEHEADQTTSFVQRDYQEEASLEVYTFLFRFYLRFEIDFY